VVADRRRKSIGAETTFARDLVTWTEVPPVLAPLFARIWAVCQNSGVMARTVTAKVKYADFQQITRARSVADGIASQAMMEQLGLELLRPLFPPPRGVRLLGITLSNFDDPGNQTHQQLALTLV
jgi:DNA polymerase-4